MQSAAPFLDRVDAGRQLSERLGDRCGENPIVLALPKGGLPVAQEVARALNCPLDVIPVQKIGAPFEPEFAIGAVAEGGAVVWNEDALRWSGLDETRRKELVEAATVKLQASSAAYEGVRAPADLHGRTAIIVDDGLATGMTARAAILACRERGAARVVLAAPVCARESAADLSREADELVCVLEPDYFSAVGRWYIDFSQVEQDEAVGILRANRTQAPAAQHPGGKA